MIKARIIFVMGKLCSGKNTFCEKLHGYKHVVVSDIVKKISGALTREELQNTSHLDKAIANELINQIGLEGKVVIDGIRQASIFFEIARLLCFPEHLVIWLEVPEEELKRRYNERGDKKDQFFVDKAFEQALERDDKLGLKELENYLKDNKNTLIIKNYDRNTVQEK